MRSLSTPGNLKARRGNGAAGPTLRHCIRWTIHDGREPGEMHGPENSPVEICGSSSPIWRPSSTMTRCFVTFEVLGPTLSSVDSMRLVQSG